MHSKLRQDLKDKPLKSRHENVFCKKSGPCCDPASRELRAYLVKVMGLLGVWPLACHECFWCQFPQLQIIDNIPTMPI